MADEAYTLPPAAAPTNHGHTTAAWVLVVGVIAGALILGVGLAIANPTLWITGIIVIAGSVLASLGLRARGHGQPLTAARRGDWYTE